ncbi:uncharacterized protein METZ01_LOCUS305234 [marine metagenome]|uniref:Uncharacterized protein n=1 Tax=marine metagenome TaxID=408172 RepID=A0A382MV12_9ZZZZ
MFPNLQTIYSDLSGSRLKKPGQHLHDCGLAGSIMAKQADDLASVNAETNVIDGGRTAIAADKVLDVDHLVFVFMECK